MEKILEKIEKLKKTNPIKKEIIIDMLKYSCFVNKKNIYEHLKNLNKEKDYKLLKNIVFNNYDMYNIETILKFQTMVIEDKKVKLGLKTKNNYIIDEKNFKKIQTESYIDIEEKLKKFLIEYKNLNENFFDKITLFHINFAKLHPFFDGNGRVARLITNLELLKNSYTIIQKNKEYLDAFRFYNKYSSSKKLKEYILKEVLENYSDIVEKERI